MLANMKDFIRTLSMSDTSLKSQFTHASNYVRILTFFLKKTFSSPQLRNFKPEAQRVKPNTASKQEFKYSNAN